MFPQVALSSGIWKIMPKKKSRLGAAFLLHRWLDPRD